MEPTEQDITVAANGVRLAGTVIAAPDAAGVVLFAHGGRSGRHSARNRFIAETLAEAGLASVLVDLLTEEEQAIEQAIHTTRFDIARLAARVDGAIDWLRVTPRFDTVPIAAYGAGAAAAAVIFSAARPGSRISAIVSRGGRPDLAGSALERVEAPTLLVVGGDDETLLRLNLIALDRMRCEKALEIVPGAGHQFEEPGALEHVAGLAAWWLRTNLDAAPRRRIEVIDRRA